MKYYLHNISKTKTDILGYWKDGKKIFIDNIYIREYANKKAFKIAKKSLFAIGELAIFYKIGNKAIIENRQGDITILNKRIEYKYKSSYENVQKIKDIIKAYGGCTVYRKKGYILIEVFTKG